MESGNEFISIELESEELSLESILAEYKGTAFIDGDKKTPSEILDAAAEKIIMEVVSDSVSGSLLTSEPVYEAPRTQADVVYPAAPAAAPSAAPAEQAAQSVHVPIRPPEQSVIQKDVTQSDSSVSATDSDVLFFENYTYSSPESTDTIADDIETAIEKETELREDTSQKVRGFFNIFRRERVEETAEETIEEEYYEEPDLGSAAKKYAESCNSISLRSLSASFISLIMIVLTLAFEAGMTLPLGIRHDSAAAAGTLMLMLLFVMLLCADLITRGALDMVHGVPNVESLILFSCAFSLISGAVTIIKGGSEIMPYCVISALSLTFAALGEKYYLRAVTETLKTANVSSEPYGVVAEYDKELKKSVLKKTYNRTSGFFNNLMQPDVTETAYRFASPILLAAALVLSVFTAVAKSRGAEFLHILSAMLAAAAPFSSIIAFAVPFSSIARTARKSGTAIAGWGGADDVCHTDGACVTDDDLFPTGTQTLGGIKIFEDVSPEKSVRYTASLIIASGSGLSRVFSDVLKKQGMSLIRIEDFACYEGGIGAVIRGERVMVGSAAFMNLQGIRIPDDMNLKNAVFTAINDRLIAMFAIEYVPVNSVQSALIAILKWRIKLFFAVRDFNVTPLMLEQKFKVSLDDIEYIPIQNSYSISDANSETEGRIAAVLSREGLGPFAEAITGGRLLRTTTVVSTAVSILSAAAGLLMTFFMCWVGAFNAVRPGSLLIFMLSMLAAVLIVCGYIKCRK